MADLPNPDDVTPPAQDDATSGTPAAEAPRNAEADDNQKKLLQSLQEKAARVNDAERRAASAEAEIDRLRRAAQSPAAPAPGVDPRQQRLRETVAWAQGQRDPEGKQDPVAGVVVDLATDLEIERMRRAESEALSEIEDKAMRKKIKEHLEANRHRLGDVDAARAEIEAQSVEEMRAENERLNAALRAAQAPTGSAPPTHHQPVPASTLKARQMTPDEWEQHLKGKSTFERLREIEKLGSEYVVR